MNRQVKTKAERRAEAALKVESSACQLIEACEDLAANSNNSGHRRYHRMMVLEWARAYARALDALSRVG